MRACGCLLGGVSLYARFGFVGTVARILPVQMGFTD